METIPKADCQNIGVIKKTHGVHGQVILEFESRFEKTVENAQRFFVELDGLLVPFFVGSEGMRLNSAKSAIICFDWVETEDYASRLVGNKVFLFHKEIVPAETVNAPTDFQNYILIDNKIGEVGRITKADNFSGNIVFTVQYKSNEVLIPYSEQLTVKINRRKKSITMSIPEGLL